MSGDFNPAYRGTPPWDIGRAQPVVVSLAQEGFLGGRVLDAGCGTGENALFLAGFGCQVVGVDGAPLAIQKARSKARERKLEAEFQLADVLDLSGVETGFDAALDCGLFHTFIDEERLRYIHSLAAVMKPGAHFALLCFSELEQGLGGPRRVTQAEIRAAFSKGWEVVSIQPARFETNFGPGGAQAWLAKIVYSDGSTKI
jgi:cyclopropane fatty-acyl-phospholipid synthase-like methyltransferase